MFTRYYNILLWVNLAIIVIGTVSDVGFPARGGMCPIRQFSEGHFVFRGSLHCIILFFYANVTGVMLSKYQ